MYKYKLKERAFTQPQDVRKYQEERIAAFDKITQPSIKRLRVCLK